MWQLNIETRYMDTRNIETFEFRHIKMDLLCGNLKLRLDTWIQDTWKHLISNTLKRILCAAPKH